MLNTKMQALGENRSVIRDLFEYGKKRKKEIGEDKVFDFSLGNPCVPAPDPVNETIYDLLDSQDDVYLHGYTSAQGDLLTRRTIAADLNRRFGTSFQADNLYMTCGAAASLKISLTALIVPDAGDEVLTFAPYFPEYRVFAETAGAVFRFIPTDPETFQIRIPELEKLVGENTKAVIINSPNNPSGVVYPEAVIRELSAFLTAKEKEYGHPIYLIADEPYRELVYDGKEVPFIPDFYKNTIIGYSFSKSLSLPGERIGYIAIPREINNFEDIYMAAKTANRIMGFVNAPSLMQRVVANCLDERPDSCSVRLAEDAHHHVEVEVAQALHVEAGVDGAVVRQPRTLGKLRLVKGIACAGKAEHGKLPVHVMSSASRE